TGKSYLATALGYQACQNGYKVLYVNTGVATFDWRNLVVRFN
ncbi:ATP-binding protein, partial [Pedobacter petrophilus]